MKDFPDFFQKNARYIIDLGREIEYKFCSIFFGTEKNDGKKGFSV
jgi:hypothetical protein